jgi:hypothetical protein
MSTTIAAESNIKSNEQIQFPDPNAPVMKNPSAITFLAAFDKIKDKLSAHPLRRPPRSSPLPQVTVERLKRLAQTHRPPEEWFEGEDERPF